MADRLGSQKKVLGALGGVAAFAIAAVFTAIEGDAGGGGARVAATDIETSVLEGVRRSAEPESIWVRQSENRFREMGQEIQRLRETNETLQAQVEANVKSEKAIVSEIGESVNAQITKLAERVIAAEERARTAEDNVKRLTRDLADVNEGVAAKIAAASTARDGGRDARPTRASFTPGQGTNEFVTANRRASGDAAARRDASAPGQGGGSGDGGGEAAPQLQPAPSFVNFSLDGDKDTRKTLTGYLPAGSYASAVVVSGVDASAGVQQSSDPRPVLIRVTGPAITAAAGQGAGQEVDIVGCMITAEAVGDLSSERVFPRLIAMTCSPEEGVVSETPVVGFVAGQGKAGVRGRVVSREGDLVENAAIAGAFSGLSGLISDIGSTASGDVTSDDSLQGLDTILGRGLLDAGGQGAGAAFDRLASYYIQRAEQYQPVISLYGGTPVEVVFLKGVKIDG